MKLDWRLLYYGHVSPQEGQEDARWQELRQAMKGQPLETKYTMLRGYQMSQRELKLSAHEWRMVEVKITKLSRGGLIKPSDYR